MISLVLLSLIINFPYINVLNADDSDNIDTSFPHSGCRKYYYTI